MAFKTLLTLGQWVMTIHGVGRLVAITGQHATVEFSPGSNPRLFELRTLDHATPAEYHVSSARKGHEMQYAGTVTGGFQP